MSTTLARCYTYGNFTDLPSLGPEADFFYGVPARQRELIALARTQIDLQRAVASDLQAAHAVAAKMIQGELRRQTEHLEAAIRAGTDVLASAIVDLGDRVTGELVEIRWELVQLRAVSEQILAVLRRPRSTEAQELLQQGVRNLVNDKIEQAEDRFRLALRLDNTDYQVLMNLSAVELRKGNAKAAIQYVQDALTLPPSLDDVARADALWHLARLYYVCQDYGAALRVVEQSVALLSRPRRTLQRGVYAVLAGSVPDGLSLVAEAVRADPRLFAIAISSPDLAPHRREVVHVLSQLAEEALGHLCKGLDSLGHLVQSVATLDAISATQKSRFRALCEGLQRLSNGPSYSECREGLVQVGNLSRAADSLRRLSKAELALVRLIEDEAEATRRVDRARRSRDKLPKRPGCISAMAGFVAYIFIFLAFFNLVVPALGLDVDANTPLNLFLAILLYGSPFWIGIPIYLTFARSERRAEAFLASAQARLAQLKADVASGRATSNEAAKAAVVALDSVRV